MLEFPTARNDWRLDVVSILAVVGESNIKIHAQTLTASRLCLLPRLIPAPQAFLREKRPRTLPYEEDITVVDVSGAQVKNGLNYFANLLTLVDSFAPYSVYEFEISENEKARDRSHPRGPLNMITVLSSLLTLGLLIWSILIHDGVACLALIVMSLTSTAFGASCLWRTSPPQRSPIPQPTPTLTTTTAAATNKVIIRTRSSTFIVVTGPAPLLQALYFSPEECHYTLNSLYARMLGGTFGGVFLSLGVILLGNASWTMQAAIGASYTILNAMYWLLTTLPARVSWDLTRYQLKECGGGSGGGSGGGKGNGSGSGGGSGSGSGSGRGRGKGSGSAFTKYENGTRALWGAILSTRSTRWVGVSGAVPQTEEWGGWVREAERRVVRGDVGWDCEGVGGGGGGGGAGGGTSWGGVGAFEGV